MIWFKHENVVQVPQWDEDKSPLHDRPPMDWGSIGEITESQIPYEESALSSMNPEYIAVSKALQGQLGIWFHPSLPDVVCRFLNIRKWRE
jgi:hypothetical protein